MPIDSITILNSSANTQVKAGVDKKVVFKAINSGAAEFNVYGAAAYELKHEGINLAAIPVLEVFQSSIRKEFKDHLEKVRCEAKPTPGKTNGDCVRATVKKLSTAGMTVANPIIEDVILASIASLRTNPAARENLVREFGKELYGKLRALGVSQFIIPKNFEGEKAPYDAKASFPLWMMQGFMEAAMLDETPGIATMEVFCADSRFNEAVLQQAVDYGAARKAVGPSVAPQATSVKAAPSKAPRPSTAPKPSRALAPSVFIDVDNASSQVSKIGIRDRGAALVASMGGALGTKSSIAPSAPGSNPASQPPIGRVSVPAKIAGLFGNASGVPAPSFGAMSFAPPPPISSASAVARDIDQEIASYIVARYAAYLQKFGEEDQSLNQRFAANALPLVISADHVGDYRSETGLVLDSFNQYLGDKGVKFSVEKPVFVLVNSGGVDGGHWEFDRVNIKIGGVLAKGTHFTTTGAGWACGANCVMKILKQVPLEERQPAIDRVTNPATSGIAFSEDEKSEIARFFSASGPDELSPELARKFVSAAAWISLNASAEGRKMDSNERTRIYHDILSRGNQIEYKSLFYALDGLGIQSVNASEILQHQSLAPQEYFSTFNMTEIPNSDPAVNARITAIKDNPGLLMPRFASQCAPIFLAASARAPLSASALAPSAAASVVAPSVLASVPVISVSAPPLSVGASLPPVSASAPPLSAGVSLPPVSVVASVSVPAPSLAIPAASQPVQGNARNHKERIVGYSTTVDGKLKMTVMAPGGAQKNIEIASQFVNSAAAAGTTVLDVTEMMRATSKLEKGKPSGSPSLADAWNLLIHIRSAEIDVANAAKGGRLP
jgi:hypothetical protein